MQMVNTYPLILVYPKPLEVIYTIEKLPRNGENHTSN